MGPRWAEWLGWATGGASNTQCFKRFFSSYFCRFALLLSCQTAIDEAVRVALAEQAAQAAARNPKRKGIRGVASRLFDKVF